jgi:hypothetical protein
LDPSSTNYCKTFLRWRIKMSPRSGFTKKSLLLRLVCEDLPSQVAWESLL